MIIPRADQKFTLPRWAAAIGRDDKWTQREFAKRGIRPSGVVPVNGRTFPGYSYQDLHDEPHNKDLPAELQLVIQANARRDGYNDLAAFVSLDKPEWQPPFALALVHPEELTEAGRWMEALRPALERLSNYPEQVADAMRQARDGAARMFTRKPSDKVIRARLEMVRLRARGSADYEKLSFYLPDRPRMQEAQPTAPTGRFDDLRQRLESVPREKPGRKKCDPPEKPISNREIRKARKEYDIAVTSVWQCALAHYERLTTSGTEPRLARAQILDVLKNGWLAPNPEALRKQFEHRLAHGAEDRRKDNGGEDSELTRQIESLGWFIPAAEFFYPLANRNWNSGSTPEAIRRTISLPNLPTGWSAKNHRQFARKLRDAGFNSVPECPKSLREQILARQKAGMAMVPESIRRQIICPGAIVRQRRNPTNAALDLLNAAGSLFFITDRTTGERRPPMPGEVIEADDATINFPVCVPWKLGGDPCSDKFGVKVGRFQWLVAVDAASRYITAWSYVMRPRSSYRGEDALMLMRAHCAQHGIPAQWRFEQGVWKSNLVKNAIAHLGSELHTVVSPHQKPFVEGTFNALWTKLAVQFPDADVGRYRGENEAACALITACQRGQKDPRQHFPMLSTALAAFGEVIGEKSQTPVNSKIGRWIPAERWEQSTFAKRELTPDREWLFSPYVREWTVKGTGVGGKVPILEDFSVPFDFQKDDLWQFDGAKVRAHFDPASPNCRAMLVLAEDYNNRRAGHEIGFAQQINEVAGYVRTVLGWGHDDPSEGRIMRQQIAGALRRETRAVIPHGRGGYEHSEERDGVAQVVKLEKNIRALPVTAEESSEAALRRMLERDEEQERRNFEADKAYMEMWMTTGADRRYYDEAKSRVDAYLIKHPEEARLERQRDGLEKLMNY